MGKNSVFFVAQRQKLAAYGTQALLEHSHELGHVFFFLITDSHLEAFHSNTCMYNSC